MFQLKKPLFFNDCICFSKKKNVPPRLLRRIRPLPRLRLQTLPRLHRVTTHDKKTVKHTLKCNFVHTKRFYNIRKNIF